MIEMTSSQRKMLAQIQKSKEKGIRWDNLYQKYGDVASYQELLELTRQGLLKIVNANGAEMDVQNRLPNPPKANELYAVCTWTARDIIKKDRGLTWKERVSFIGGIIGTITGIAGVVLSIIALKNQQPPK